MASVCIGIKLTIIDPEYNPFWTIWIIFIHHFDEILKCCQFSILLAALLKFAHVLLISHKTFSVSISLIFIRASYTSPRNTTILRLNVKYFVWILFCFDFFVFFLFAFLLTNMPKRSSEYPPPHYS